MRNLTPSPTTLWLLLTAVVFGVGCQRAHYRLSADADAYGLTAEKTAMTRAIGSEYPIYVDPASRMYDPFDPDHEPMPPDDPASHTHMHWIDNMKGWKKWHDNGDTPYVENPCWEEYLYFDEDGCIVLSSHEAYRLARLHSRDYQRQLEELYLSALDVSFERFRFDTQFFYGRQTEFFTQGLDAAPINRLTDASQLNSAKLFPSGGTMVTQLANSLVWEFTGNNTFTPTVLANFVFVQPLLRNGGKARVLERLTISERTLLANVRAMERYRRGFYVEILTGQDAGGGPNRRGGVFGGAGLEGFTGIGGGGFGRLTGGGGDFSGGGAGAGQAGGYMGLLQEQQNIRNLEFNVAGLQANLARLQAMADAEHPDPAEQLRSQLQVEQAKQALYSAQSRLLNSKIACQESIDSFKINMGLPPQMCVKVDDPMLDQFLLIDDDIIGLQNELSLLQRDIGRLLVEFRREANHTDGTLPWREGHAQRLKQLAEMIAQLKQSRAKLNEMLDELDASGCEEAIERRRERLTMLRQRYLTKPLGSQDPCLAPEAERRLQQQVRDLLDVEYMDDALREIEALRRSLRADLEKRETALARVEAELKPLLDGGRELTDEQIYRILFGEVGGFGRGVFQVTDVLAELAVDALEMSLAAAKQRAMCVDLTPVDLDDCTALEIARANRRDWMNARAGLVDTWRLIEFNANDLKSSLDVVFEGDITDVSDFTTGSLTARLELDAPLQRVAERNNYRQALIEYQQARRNYYTFTDGVARSLRSELRALEVNEINFEARRKAVLAAIDQVVTNRLIQDQPAAPGATREVGVTAARDAVSALSDLLNAQNDFLSVWVSYEVLRRVLDRDLGTMQLDFDGYWIDPGIIGPETGFLLPSDCNDCLLEDELFGPPNFEGNFTPELIPPGERAPEDLPVEPSSGDALRAMGLRVVEASHRTGKRVRSSASGKQPNFRR